MTILKKRKLCKAKKGKRHSKNNVNITWFCTFEIVGLCHFSSQTFHGGPKSLVLNIRLENELKTTFNVTLPGLAFKSIPVGPCLSKQPDVLSLPILA